jgi:hypothetical protein
LGRESRSTRGFDISTASASASALALTAALTVAVPLSCQGAAATPSPAHVVVYRGASLIDGTGGPPSTARVIVTTGERITAIVNLRSVVLTVKRGSRYPHRDYRP